MSAQENYEKLLSAHHGRMIDFVKFAETKNAALLTFCSVWIGSIITMLRAEGTLPTGYGMALVTALPMLTLAALISLVSFLPKAPRHYLKPEERKDRNLLFFGDIATMKAATYAERVRDRYRPTDDGDYTERYLDDLISQISIQSQIAHDKFNAFRRAASIVIGAFVVVIIPPLWWALQWALHAARTGSP